MVTPTKELSHLFLDLDGTLINSLPRLRSIYHDFLTDHHIEGSNQEFETLKTSSIEKLIEYFKMTYSMNYPSHYLKQQYEKYLQKHYFSAPLFRGVKEFLQQIKSENYTLICTTANQKECAEKILTYHKLLPLIDKIYTPACFDLTKKDVQFYSNVTKDLNIMPQMALVIDDSLEVISSSIQSGLQALLFSKITYHPLPCFGSWKTLLKQWPGYVYT